MLDQGKIYINDNKKRCVSFIGNCISNFNQVLSLSWEHRSWGRRSWGGCGSVRNSKPDWQRLCPKFISGLQRYRYHNWKWFYTHTQQEFRLHSQQEVGLHSKQEVERANRGSHVISVATRSPDLADPWDEKLSKDNAHGSYWQISSIMLHVNLLKWRNLIGSLS